VSYDNNLRGALFKNLDKTEDSHPDYRGNIEIDGREYWLDAWLATAKNTGKKYMRLKAKPKLQSDKASPPTGGKNDPRPF
jgi:uncharacterized protein (DUF736 family)